MTVKTEKVAKKKSKVEYRVEKGVTRQSSTNPVDSAVIRSVIEDPEFIEWMEDWCESNDGKSLNKFFELFLMDAFRRKHIHKFQERIALKK